MRQIILDTETTGLDPKLGHRIIELAGIELVDRRPTGRNVHFYLNPERDVDAGAIEVHGMSWDDLKDKPKFGDVAAEFLDFVRDAEWIIHNAPFDIGFLDHELARCGHGSCSAVFAKVVDTLTMAREQFPGKRNNLDALCERFGVDHAERTMHGALLDARLLADVYLAMTRGQESLTIDITQAPMLLRDAGATLAAGRARAAVIVVVPTGDELQAHRTYLEALDRESKGRCVWLALENVAAA